MIAGGCSPAQNGTKSDRSLNAIWKFLHKHDEHLQACWAFQERGIHHDNMIE